MPLGHEVPNQGSDGLRVVGHARNPRLGLEIGPLPDRHGNSRPALREGSLTSASQGRQISEREGGVGNDTGSLGRNAESMEIVQGLLLTNEDEARVLQDLFELRARNRVPECAQRLREQHQRLSKLPGHAKVQNPWREVILLDQVGAAAADDDLGGSPRT